MERSCYAVKDTRVSYVHHLPCVLFTVLFTMHYVLYISCLVHRVLSVPCTIHCPIHCTMHWTLNGNSIIRVPVFWSAGVCHEPCTMLYKYHPLYTRLVHDVPKILMAEHDQGDTVLWIARVCCCRWRDQAGKGPH